VVVRNQRFELLQRRGTSTIGMVVDDEEIGAVELNLIEGFFSKLTRSVLRC
jgi:hypothetical protein